MKMLSAKALVSAPKPIFKLSIRTILIVVIAVMVSVPVVVSTYLSFKYGARSSGVLVKNSADMLNANIQEKITDYFVQPVEINGMNANLILNNLLDVESQASLMKYFNAQIKTCENVSSITFANPAGGISNAGYDKSANQYYVIYTENNKSGVFYKYAVDKNGEKTELITRLPYFDARTRPWYKNAINDSGMVISDTYLMATGNNLGINASQAIRDKDNHLLGVVCVDLFLSDISKLLTSLDLAEGGQTFIMNKTGLLIASSEETKLFTLDSKTQTYTRVNAIDSESELISATSSLLKGKNADFSNIAQNTNISVKIKDESYIVQVKPFNAIENRGWLIVTVVPESTYMAQVYANNKTIIYIMTFILLLSILLAVLLAKLISQPILSLDKKIRAISQSDWSVELSPSRVLEIDDLAAEIFNMKTAIATNIENLSSEIAERKQAELFLKDIIDKNPLSIQIVDKEGYTLQVNAAHTRLFGLNPPPEYSVFKDIQIQQQDTEGLMQRAFKGETIRLPQMYYNIHDFNPEFPDNPIWVKAVIFSLKGSDGKPERYVFMHEDITEIVLYENKLKKSEEKHRFLVENSHDIIYMLTKEGIFTFVSPAWTVLLGHSPAEIVGKSFQKYAHPEDIPACLAWLQKVIETGQRQEGIEYRVQHQDGTWYWHTSSAVPIKDETGATIVLNGIARDITERKQSELKLTDVRQRLAGIIEGANVGTWEWNIQTGETVYNDLWLSMIGYSLEEISPTSDETWKRFAHPEDLVTCEDILEKYFSGELDYYECELRMKHKNGTWVWVLDRGKVITWSEDGKPLIMMGTHTDVTKRKLAEEENTRIQTQLNQSHKMELLGQLAGGVAHDFNNLLTVIMGYSAELSSNLPPHSQDQNNAEEIFNAGSRAKELTQQLLAFSRKQVIQAKILDLNVLIASLHGTILRLIGEHIEIVSVLSAGNAMVKADQGQIEQIIINLVLNSRDAMPNGGKITISTEILAAITDEFANMYQVPPGKYVLLSVSDNGQGMPPSVQSKIFEPFFTTKDKGRGLGLGLSMVYGMVLQSDGNIFVDSEPGKGTTVKVFLPFTQETLPSAHKQVIEKEICGNGEHILIVEDEESLAVLFQKMVSKFNYNVTVANCGAEAIGKIENGLQPDLIISDVIMPGMNGKELADKVRQLVPTQKVLFMSGFTDNIIEPHGVLGSGIPFIQKPFSANEIAVKIKTLLTAPA